jgi:hypothetical protein
LQTTEKPIVNHDPCNTLSGLDARDGFGARAVVGTSVKRAHAICYFKCFAKNPRLRGQAISALGLS